MISLEKLPIDQSLADKISQRSREFNELSARGERVPDSLQSAYKDPEVKDLIKRETSEKCAYCESKVTHVDFGDVEHIAPKTIRPDLRYEYSNLTLACSVCNNRKRDYYDENLPLLNPYLDNPDDHLIAAGPMVIRRPHSDRGLVTQRRLDLNRMPLVERRKERIEAVATLLDQLVRSQDAAIRMVLFEQIQQECASDKEYAFVVRSHVALVEPEQ